MCDTAGSIKKWAMSYYQSTSAEASAHDSRPVNLSLDRVDDDSEDEKVVEKEPVKGPAGGGTVNSTTPTANVKQVAAVSQGQTLT